MNNLLPYGKKNVRPISQLVWALAVVACILLVYVGTFEAMYARRGPAANMAYFIYSENDAVDFFAYYSFFPPYWVQRHVLGIGSTHNWDREAPSFPPDFKG